MGFRCLLEPFCPAPAFVTADSYDARNPQHFIYVTVTTHTKKPTAQMAHLVFADTQPNAEKPKEPFFFHRTTDKLKKYF